MLVGLTGVGGGSLMTPLLVLLFGFHPATAVGTDLLYARSRSRVGTAVHGKRKTVDWRHRRLPRLRQRPGGHRHALRHEPRRNAWPSHASGLLNLLLGVRSWSSPASRRCSAPRILRLGRAHIRETDRHGGRDPDHPARPGARDSGVDHLGRRRRARNHRAAHPLSQAAGRRASPAATSRMPCR